MTQQSLLNDAREFNTNKMGRILTIAQQKKLRVISFLAPKGWEFTKNYNSSAWITRPRNKKGQQATL
ncbi:MULTISPECIES: hypothetical protein [Chitinibacter]|uniref:hypothetical protein n=1 Tax=Chitinibacter TaxID=230666 RepID=UPI00041070AE|nr:MULTISPECIES: hypothetical protein [Chitinibacter]